MQSLALPDCIIVLFPDHFYHGGLSIKQCTSHTFVLSLTHLHPLHAHLHTHLHYSASSHILPTHMYTSHPSHATLTCTSNTHGSIFMSTACTTLTYASSYTCTCISYMRPQTSTFKEVKLNRQLQKCQKKAKKEAERCWKHEAKCHQTY